MGVLWQVARVVFAAGLLVGGLAPALETRVAGLLIAAAGGAAMQFARAQQVAAQMATYRQPRGYVMPERTGVVLVPASLDREAFSRLQADWPRVRPRPWPSEIAAVAAAAKMPRVGVVLESGTDALMVLLASLVEAEPDAASAGLAPQRAVPGELFVLAGWPWTAISNLRLRTGEPGTGMLPSLVIDLAGGQSLQVTLGPDPVSPRLELDPGPILADMLDKWRRAAPASSPPRPHEATVGGELGTPPAESRG